jgi:type I restriction enzyme S subunit
MNESALHELPGGWVWTRLGEVCLDPQYGWTTSAMSKGALHLLRTTDITSGNIDWSTVPFCSEEPPEKEKYLLKDGDIVISRAGSVGYSHLIKNPKGAVFASYLIRFRPLIDEKYLAYFIKSPLYWDSISEKSLGIAIPNVNATKLKQIFIPLSPLPEQHRIVTKLEELFTKLDAGVSELIKTQIQLKRYRRSVLKAAYEGKIVQTEADLAKAEGHTYEPAIVLLARIMKERREKWNGKGKYNEPDAPNTSGLHALPEGWVWSNFGQAFNVYVGATPSRKRPDYWGGQIPWVSSGEVAFCKIFQTKETITELGLTNTSTEVHPKGTVLLGMIGEGKTRGQAAILEINACNNQNSAAIRVSETGLPSEYIFYFLEGDYERTRTMGSGNNQPALNKSRVQSMLFPLPPLAEQHRIVAEVERRLSITDMVEKTVGLSLAQAKRLRQSILKKAFEGRLVAQDASDEPAGVLLERIKQQKQLSNQTNKTTRRKANGTKSR